MMGREVIIGEQISNKSELVSECVESKESLRK